jgi:hypothetical protein
MAGLKIFGTDPESQPKPRQKFADDVVGRFRSGHQINGRPAALTEWRVTTGDPEVATFIYDDLGGDEPQEWEAKGEDNLEVFTASDKVEIILEGENALRQAMVLFSRQGKLITKTDGETILYPEDDAGKPDPDAELTYQERKKKGQDGIGPVPQIEVYFRLASDPEQGIFKFVTGSWSMVYDLAANDTQTELAHLVEQSEDGKVSATLRLEGVEFVAKNGPRKGQTVSYTKPVLDLGAAL